MDIKEFAEKVKGDKVLEAFVAVVEETEKKLAEEQREKGYRLYTAFAKFTDKEIEKMPKSFAMRFAVRGCSPHAYVSKYIKDNVEGLTASALYEVFYRVNGEYVSAVGETFEKAKRKFICALCIDETKRHE